MSRSSRPIWKAVIQLLVALSLGYASRRWSGHLPDFAKKRAGDALWAVSVFALVCLIRPRWSTTKAVIVALLISYAVEFSQVLHPKWLDDLRDISIARLPIGKIILGTTFFWLDQVAYTIGIFCFAPLDYFLVHPERWRKPESKDLAGIQ